MMKKNRLLSTNIANLVNNQIFILAKYNCSETKPSWFEGRYQFHGLHRIEIDR